MCCFKDTFFFGCLNPTTCKLSQSSSSGFRWVGCGNVRVAAERVCFDLVGKHFLALDMKSLAVYLFMATAEWKFLGTCVSVSLKFSNAQCVGSHTRGFKHPSGCSSLRNPVTSFPRLPDAFTPAAPQPVPAGGGAAGRAPLSAPLPWETVACSSVRRAS